MIKKNSFSSISIQLKMVVMHVSHNYYEKHCSIFLKQFEIMQKSTQREKVGVVAACFTLFSFCFASELKVKKEMVIAL